MPAPPEWFILHGIGRPARRQERQLQAQWPAGEAANMNVLDTWKGEYRMSSDEADNKIIARRFFEAFEANDQAAFNELLAPDLVAHTQASGPVNREAMLQGIFAFNAAFSEVHFTLEDLIAEGDRVATRQTVRAIHTGDFQGLPPTGKRIAISGMTVERVEDGKIVERWVNVDYLGLMQQLGLVPPPPPAR